ncbi:hypothetical protein B0H19DRAFT_1089417 [Mycena capillaripes]|nr:hypothetical protein B0H19DRAFT_1089417 [Mycena capillaripes]
MLPTIRTEVAFSMNASGRKSKDAKLQGHQGALQVNLGPPFHLLQDADSDVETPSPLTLCFEFPKPPSSPLHATTEWTDSDSDSDVESESHFFDDDSQYISIPCESPFYSPHSRPTFQKTFDIPPVPFAPQPPTTDEDDSEDFASQFRAELECILPSEVMKDLFLIDEECLKGMDEELFSAPMDAFMDVCLSRLRPTATISGQRRRDVPKIVEESSARLPTYYLVSFLDMQRQDSLPTALRELFCKRAMSAGQQASPATARQIIPFL